MRKAVYTWPVKTAPRSERGRVFVTGRSSEGEQRRREADKKGQRGRIMIKHQLDYTVSSGGRINNFLRTT